MVTVADWAEIRRLYYAERLSKRRIAKRLHVHRNTVTVAIAAEQPPQYEREPHGSKLDLYKPKIQSLLKETPDLSAVRIQEILEGEHYAGKITILKDYLREVRPQFKPPEAFLRMIYSPGEYGQVDWAEMPDPVRYQDLMCKVYAFVMVLCYSRELYIEFSLATQLNDFLRGHQNALRAFGGSPKTNVYDNLTSVVLTRRGADVTFNETFLAFAGHYCFAPKACWPYRPNEKGVVERPIDYLKRNFWAGRTFRDWADLVAQGQAWLARANQRIHGTLKERPCDRFTYEQAFLTPLPHGSVNTDWLLFPRVTKDCVVRVATNDYSVPWRLARQPVEVRVDAHSVRVYQQGQCAAEHARFYGKYGQILNPQHYEGLWNRKPSARFLRSERLYRQAYGEVGARFFQGLAHATPHLEAALTDLLALQETYPCADIQCAMEGALQRGRCDPAVVRLLLMPTPTLRPVPISVPVAAEVEVRDLAVYDALMAGGR
ncbi:MAG: IS21 family transposase [Tumebacillaceae bacterium]